MIKEIKSRRFSLETAGKLLFMILRITLGEASLVEWVVVVVVVVGNKVAILIKSSDKMCKLLTFFFARFHKRLQLYGLF